MIDRRSFLASASAFGLAGCVTCEIPERDVSGRHLADSHVHFFNASDLPVGNFLKFVIVPYYISNPADIVLALADLGGFLAKRLSVSASAELARLGAGELFGSKVDEAKFADEAADYQERQIDARNRRAAVSQLDPETDVAESHYRLARLLGAVAEMRTNDRGEPLPARVDPEPYRRIAASGPPLRHPPHGLDEDMAALADAPDTVDLEEVKAVLRWIYDMLQSRCRHVRQYLDTVKITSGQTLDAINLLVDYDKWLDEEPLANSSHADQVRFWTRYKSVAQTTIGALRVHTFAGFDPLKDVEERRGDGANRTFARLQDWVREGRKPGSTATHRIAGFKVYPPMGFSPHRNAGRKLPNERAGARVNTRWDARNWPTAQLGAEIDASLDEFFRFCTLEDVPIMTHARESQGSMPGADFLAAPVLWLARAEETRGYGSAHRPLRVCLGHFDMRNGDDSVLRRALAMNEAGDANFYFDLSYDPRILNGEADRLLSELGEICAEFEHGDEHILFGSDWIMLGQQAAAGRYFQAVYDAAGRAGSFWETRRDKLFRQNLLGFLDLPAQT